jgi:putative FmdB family regulatory protein
MIADYLAWTLARGCTAASIYLCNDCGPFTDMRPMAEYDLPQDCPQCESEATRVILTAPAFFCMRSDKRKAPATNERSAHAPKPWPSIRLRMTPAAATAPARSRRGW